MHQTYGFYTKYAAPTRLIALNAILTYKLDNSKLSNFQRGFLTMPLPKYLTIGHNHVAFFIFRFLFFILKYFCGNETGRTVAANTGYYSAIGRASW
jgi:hypothetical protein